MVLELVLNFKAGFMRKESILKKKSFDFAVRIINLYKYLKKKHGEYTISQQILRAGTSVGALIREAEFAESRKDFVHKLYIGLKEANESMYWLELLFATAYIDRNMFQSIHKDSKEIVSMLVSSVKTIKLGDRSG
jgi:four helix bundle protein